MQILLETYLANIKKYNLNINRMSEKQIILSLNSFNCKTKISNSNWTNSLIEPITINQGDGITVRNVLLDTRTNSTNNVLIENDTTISLEYYFYYINRGGNQAPTPFDLSANFPGEPYVAPPIQTGMFDFLNPLSYATGGTQGYINPQFVAPDQLPIYQIVRANNVATATLQLTNSIIPLATNGSIQTLPSATASDALYDANNVPLTVVTYDGTATTFQYPNPGPDGTLGDDSAIVAQLYCNNKLLATPSCPNIGKPSPLVESIMYPDFYGGFDPTAVTQPSITIIDKDPHLMAKNISYNFAVDVSANPTWAIVNQGWEVSCPTFAVSGTNDSGDAVMTDGTIFTFSTQTPNYNLANNIAPGWLTDFVDRVNPIKAPVLTAGYNAGTIYDISGSPPPFYYSPTPSLIESDEPTSGYTFPCVGGGAEGVAPGSLIIPNTSLAYAVVPYASEAAIIAYSTQNELRNTVYISGIGTNFYDYSPVAVGWTINWQISAVDYSANIIAIQNPTPPQPAPGGNIAGINTLGNATMTSGTIFTFIQQNNNTELAYVLPGRHYVSFAGQQTQYPLQPLVATVVQNPGANVIVPISGVPPLGPDGGTVFPFVYAGDQEGYTVAGTGTAFSTVATHRWQIAPGNYFQVVNGTDPGDDSGCIDTTWTLTYTDTVLGRRTERITNIIQPAGASPFISLGIGVSNANADESKSITVNATGKDWYPVGTLVHLTGTQCFTAVANTNPFFKNPFRENFGFGFSMTYVAEAPQTTITFLANEAVADTTNLAFTFIPVPFIRFPTFTTDQTLHGVIEPNPITFTSPSGYNLFPPNTTIAIDNQGVATTSSNNSFFQGDWNTQTRIEFNITPYIAGGLEWTGTGNLDPNIPATIVPNTTLVTAALDETANPVTSLISQQIFQITSPNGVGAINANDWEIRFYDASLQPHQLIINSIQIIGGVANFAMDSDISMYAPGNGFFFVQVDPQNYYNPGNTSIIYGTNGIFTTGTPNIGPIMVAPYDGSPAPYSTAISWRMQVLGPRTFDITFLANETQATSLFDRGFGWDQPTAPPITSLVTRVIPPTLGLPPIISFPGLFNIQDISGIPFIFTQITPNPSNLCNLNNFSVPTNLMSGDGMPYLAYMNVSGVDVNGQPTGICDPTKRVPVKKKWQMVLKAGSYSQEDLAQVISRNMSIQKKKIQRNFYLNSNVSIGVTPSDGINKQYEGILTDTMPYDAANAEPFIPQFLTNFNGYANGAYSFGYPLAAYNPSRYYLAKNPLAYPKPGLPINQASLLALDPNYEVPPDDDDQPFLFRPIAYAKPNPLYIVDSSANGTVIGVQNYIGGPIPLPNDGPNFFGNFPAWEGTVDGALTMSPIDGNEYDFVQGLPVTIYINPAVGTVVGDYFFYYYLQANQLFEVPIVTAVVAGGPGSDYLSVTFTPFNNVPFAIWNGASAATYHPNGSNFASIIPNDGWLVTNFPGSDGSPPPEVTGCFFHLSGLAGPNDPNALSYQITWVVPANQTPLPDANGLNFTFVKGFATDPFQAYNYLYSAGMCYNDANLFKWNTMQQNLTTNPRLVDVYFGPFLTDCSSPFYQNQIIESGINTGQLANVPSPYYGIRPVMTQQLEYIIYNNVEITGADVTVSPVLQYSPNYEVVSPLIGASQMSLLFNDQNNGLFEFNYMHSPLFVKPDPAQSVVQESVGMYPAYTYPQPNDSAGLRTPPQGVFTASKQSGIIFSSMEPRSFWSALGFDVSNCIANPPSDDPGAPFMAFEEFYQKTTGAFNGSANNYNNQITMVGSSEAYYGSTMDTYSIGGGVNIGPTNGDDITSAVFQNTYNQTPIYFASAGATDNLQASQISLQPNDSGHYLIEITGYSSEFLNDYQKTEIKSIVNNYFVSSNSFVTQNGSDAYTYFHQGAAITLSQLKIRILNPVTLKEMGLLGPNSSIYVQISKIIDTPSYPNINTAQNTQVPYS